MMQGKRGRWVAVAAIVAALLATIVGSAAAVTLRVGDLVAVVDGSVTPEKLSRKVLSPISFEVSGSLGSVSGARLPATRTFTLDADSQGEFFTRGLPACPSGELQGVDTERALRACGDALVGRGTTSAVLAFPDQTPYVVNAPLLMFYGGEPGGKLLLLMHVYARRPVATTFVVPGVVTRTNGVYGTRTEVTIPEIAGGYGSLRSFDVRIHRTWRLRGKVRSFLVARCARGHYLGHAEFAFVDGTRFGGTLLKRCTPVG